MQLCWILYLEGYFAMHNKCAEEFCEVKFVTMDLTCYIFCCFMFLALNWFADDVLKNRTDDCPIFLVGDEVSAQLPDESEENLPLEPVVEMIPDVMNKTVVHENGNQSNFASSGNQSNYPSSAFLLVPPPSSPTSTSLSSTVVATCASSDLNGNCSMYFLKINCGNLLKQNEVNIIGKFILK